MMGDVEVGQKDLNMRSVFKETETESGLEQQRGGWEEMQLAGKWRTWSGVGEENWS